jgi:hypothetical protein
LTRPVNPSASCSALLGCLACLWFGCASEDAPTASDAGVTNAAGGGAAHAGAGGSSGASSIALGSPCTQDKDCGGKLFCDREMKQTLQVQGAPGNTIEESKFPGGSCTPKPLAAYDEMGTTSCDPTAPTGAQGCGSNGVCTIETQDATPDVACRLACEPSATATGCDRAGYTCDFNSHACMESCRSDAECRLLLTDANGDGTADGYTYDSSSRSTCDTATGRCTHAGGAQAAGASCMRSEDCANDSVCIADGTQVAGLGFPGGFCTKRGCDVAGRECASGNVCEMLRPVGDGSATEPLCLTRCTVGAEPESLRTGPMGHGAGCRAGYSCHYNGGPGAEAGVCVGGVYNEVSANNVGAACKSNADCYSPYGAGNCLIYGLPNNKMSAGICTIADCLAPGLPKNLCGSGNECVSDNGDQTACAHLCKAATDCPETYACMDDDNDPTTDKTCYPVCLTAADCRSGEQCALFSGQKVGQCGLQ